MAYTGAPSTVPNDAIRLLIWDTSTSTSSEILSDLEVTYFRNAHGNYYMAAAMAALAISGKYSAKGASKTVGDLSIDYAGQAKSYTDLSKDLLKRAKLGANLTVTGITVSGKNTALDDSDRIGSLFAIAMHDDPGNPQPGSINNTSSTGNAA